MTTNTYEKEFTYRRNDFEAIRKRLYQLTGIKLADSKDALVYSRLARRLRKLHLKSFEEYMRYLEAHTLELEEFVNALTTNLTSFYREPHHFDILTKYLLNNPGRKRIWCAAASTGEEPYSIAMTVVETFGKFNPPVEIIASDIDSNALSAAASGIYQEERVKNLKPQQLKQFFYRGVGNNSGKVKVVPDLKKLVQFRKINLTDKQWNLGENIDIIFCRNVMIYFDKSTQLKILEKMINTMNPGGLYIAGHSENFSHATHLVNSLGNTVYRPVKGAQ